MPYSMVHKAFIMLLIAALLLFAVLTGAAFAAGAFSAATPELLDAAYDAQLVRDTLYVLMEQRLVSTSYGQSAFDTVVDLSEHPQLNEHSSMLFSDNKTLYALDTSTDVVYRLDDSTLEPIATLDFSEAEPTDASMNIIIEYPMIQNGALYTLCTDPADYTQALYRFSLDNGQGARISTSDYTFQEIVAYRDGQLLGLVHNTRKLVVIDGMTGKTVDEIGTLSGSSVGAIAYDAARDMVYSRSDAEVVRWEKQKPVTVGYMTAEDAGSALFVGLRNGQYILICHTGLYACDTASGEATKPLTIWSMAEGLLDSKLLLTFTELNPQTPVVVRGTADDDPLDKLVTSSMTRDASIDIFTVSSQDIDSQEIFIRGYAAPLSSSLLIDDLGSMYPQIRDYLIQDDILFGFPAALWTRYWTVQPELLETSELGAVPKLLDDYYDMLLRWYKDNYHSHPGMTFDGSHTIREQWQEAIYLLISQYIHTYASNEKPLSFNTPVFRAALEKIITLSKWKGYDNVRSDRQEARESIFQTNAIEPFFQAVNDIKPVAQYILPPALGDAGPPVLPSTMVYFIINPHSQNKKEAIQFLEYFSQNMELMLRYQLHPDDNRLIERQMYQRKVQAYVQSIADIKARLAALENDEYLMELKDELAQEEARLLQEEANRWEYSPEAIAEYRKLAPYMALKHGDLLWDVYESLDIETILSKYFEGYTTLDQALSELDHKVAIMFLEAQ